MATTQRFVISTINTTMARTALLGGMLCIMCMWVYLVVSSPVPLADRSEAYYWALYIPSAALGFLIILALLYIEVWEIRQRNAARPKYRMVEASVSSSDGEGESSNSDATEDGSKQ